MLSNNSGSHGNSNNSINTHVTSNIINSNSNINNVSNSIVSSNSSTTATSASTSSSKWGRAQKELAALNFLLGIPLEAERSIVRNGLLLKGGHHDESNDYAGSTSPPKKQEQLYKDPNNSNNVLQKISNHDCDNFIPDDNSNSNSNSSDPILKPNRYVLTNNNNTNQRWWDKLILQDKSGFFAAEDERMQQQARLEMEESELEGPSSSSNTNNSNNTNYPPTILYNLNSKVESNTNINASNTNNTISNTTNSNGNNNVMGNSFHPLYVTSMTPGRQLEGREDAIRIHVPFLDIEYTDTLNKTRHVSIARQALIRDWETRTAHGIRNNNDNNRHNSASSNQKNPGLLDGRSFLSCNNSYPLGVFSIIKYEPQKEEAARRRKKLEALGGGGTQFVVPQRDWRGISYRALCRQKETNKKDKTFDRLIRQRLKSKPLLYDQDHNEKNSSETIIAHGGTLPNNINQNCTNGKSKDSDGDDDKKEDCDDTLSLSSSSSSDDESHGDNYDPGFLDDPEMVQGRHRHVMVGDKVTGCIVSSTIQFVKPANLKADLNKQFRERFDGWEPPESQRKLIGAKFIDGVYTLWDPKEQNTKGENNDNNNNDAPNNSNTSSSDANKNKGNRENNNNSTSGSRENSSISAIIRMPPSLTLSKIRKLKQQAVEFCVLNADLEVSTVALACVYFERLCLACQVDKSNRRLTFASCLLLAAKINEANVAIVHDNRNHNKNNKDNSNNSKATDTLKSWIKPNTKHTTIFASLLEFFTREWSLPLKTLFGAEWGVFAALGFSLHATPSQVAFHFKRLMKTLELSTVVYLKSDMYNQWQDSLRDEVLHKKQYIERRELRQKKKERKLLRLQRELHLQQKEEKKRQIKYLPDAKREPDNNSNTSTGNLSATTKTKKNLSLKKEKKSVQLSKKTPLIPTSSFILSSPNSKSVSNLTAKGPVIKFWHRSKKLGPNQQQQMSSSSLHRVESNGKFVDKSTSLTNTLITPFSTIRRSASSPSMKLLESSNQDNLIHSPRRNSNSDEYKSHHRPRSISGWSEQPVSVTKEPKETKTNSWLQMNMEDDSFIAEEENMV